MQRTRFRDFDAFANSIDGVESKMLLRNPQRATWNLCRVDLTEVPVQLGQLGSGNIAQGELHANGYLLYMPLTDQCEYRGNGVVVEKDSFAILDPGCEFCISTKVPHDWCAVTVPAELLSHQPYVDAATVSDGRATVRVTRADLTVSRQFRETVGQIIVAASQCPGFESTPAATVARAELLKVARRAASLGGSEGPKGGRSLISRDEIVRRATTYLEQHAGERVLVGGMASAADVSERTLRTAFNEYFGIGPVRYLQIRQLHRVRRALVEADAEAVSVTNVLTDYGEWEFSRFAARYKRQFGELPSVTLRKSVR